MVVALKTLGQLNDPEFAGLFRVLANDVLDAFEASPPFVELPDESLVPRFETTLFPFMRLIEGLFAERYTLAQLKEVMTILNTTLKGQVNGTLLRGIFIKDGSKGSRSWLSASFNKGNLFEIIGIRNLTSGPNPLVNGANLKTAGEKMAVGGSTLEGDFVEALADATERWIDMKGVDGNFDLAELDRIEEALETGRVREWVFGYNTNMTPPTVWSDRVAAINATLSGGVKPIMVVPAGAF
jgi:hypothetical protein